MKINRRNLLVQLGIQLPVLIAGPAAANAQLPFKSFHLVLSDVSAATPPGGFLAILEPFMRAKIPISCIVTPETASGMIHPSSELAGYLRHLVARDPAQIEVIIQTPHLGDRPYYFQSRRATQARRAFEDALFLPQSRTALAHSVLTVANTGTTMDYQLGGVRAAGFRTALTLPQSGTKPVDSHWDQGVLHIFGGMHFGLSAPFFAIEQMLKQSIRDDPRSLLNLSINGLTSENVRPTVAHMSRIAALVSELTDTGKIVPTTPTDYHSRVMPDADTVIGLRLNVSGRPDEQKNLGALELAQWLRAHEFAFTVAGKDALDWSEFSSDTCISEETTRRDDQGRCELRDSAMPDQEVAFALPPKVMMNALPMKDRIAGVDNNATLHPPRFAFVDTQNTPLVPAIRLLEDTVLVLDANSYSTAAQRQKTTNFISALSHRAGFQITDVTTYADKIWPRDSICRVYLQTQEVMHRERAALAEYEPLNHDLIRRDAALAWRYLKRFTNAKTGLIPSTVSLGGGDATFYNYATMWDIGSQLFGMIAAVKLELMAMEELNQWATLIIDRLPTVIVQGLRLPSAIIHVGAEEEPDQAFNTCDVGRLLNAFHSLAEFSPELKDGIAEKVASWSLQETIQNGRAHDMTAHQSSDHFLSHCSDYAARGYAAFGIAADSPYAPLNGRADADKLNALLFSASEIGIIGAEPLLLEGVELGFTPQSQYLADMLFAAQLEDNRNTGTMRCVSESPINRFPWFTYQGYDIGDIDDPWKVQVISDDKALKHPDFLRAIEVVSVKAAYLWAATHPHSYSNALVAHARSRARIADFGFSPGIFLKTGHPMEGYSDLNTNAIILEACAQIVKG